MTAGMTKRYFEEILEVTGVSKKGGERLHEIRNMSEDEFKRFAGDLSNRVQDHYKRHAGQIVESLRRYKGHPKAFYFGGTTPLQYAREETPVDWFVRKAALYYGKIAMIDPLEDALFIRDAFKVDALRDNITLLLASLGILWPWVEADLIETLPNVQGWNKSVGEMVSEFAYQDFNDEEWASPKGALKDEDSGLRGEALIQYLERMVQETALQRTIDEQGGPRASALAIALRGSSMTTGSAFFGAALTASSPTTDMGREWRLFALWSSKRAELLVQRGELKEETWRRLREEAMAGRVWQGLKVEKLGALMKLSPEQIIKIRDDSKLSLKSFREGLGKRVKEIETLKLADEEEIGPIISQVSDDLNKEAEDVEKDLKNIKRKIGVSAGLTPLGLSLGLLPFSEAKLASMLFGVYSLKDIARDWSDMQTQKERSGYFLVRLEEEVEEQEVRGRRRDI